MSAAAAAAAADPRVIRERFKNFLTQKDNEKYASKLSRLISEVGHRFIVNINDLRSADAELAEKVASAPVSCVQELERAVKELVLESDPTFFDKRRSSMGVVVNFSKKDDDRINIGFDGAFGDAQVTPRTLSADHLSRLVCVQGIVTKCSLVRPKVVRSVHYCPTTNEFEDREYRDNTDMSGRGPTGSVYPSKDSAGNLLETEFGYSTYEDIQTFSIQEMPEAAPLGQLPRSVDVMVRHDLVDRVKPGDRVAVVGIYRALAGGGGVTNGLFRTVLLANNVRQVGKDHSNISVNAPDARNIRDAAEKADAFQMLARSLAPSIYGHRIVKQALALLLLGGTEHNLANGTHLRGDINILMVGDPSTAKSQLLRFVLNLAPVAVNTTGRGSSGVGLTAAVTTDPETGERRLEAGAMVLADRGVVCIDEFDKMSDGDRVAIHEVMEQQTVTIAKAGIQASLNARCSVVAAANPVYGRFDSTLSLARNVSLPDSLLSRFDATFIVRDNIKRETDMKLADHVVRMHRYVRPGQEGLPVPLDAGSKESWADDADKARDETEATPPYQRYNPILHGGAAAEAEEDGETSGTVALFTVEFMRKFIHFAKGLQQPTLSKGARDAIVDTYTAFRQRAKGRQTVVTARALESLIRFSCAHAKCKLRSKVRREDVDVARRIMSYALYGDEKALEASAASVPEAEADVEVATPPRSSAAAASRKRNHDEVAEGSDNDQPQSKRAKTFPSAGTHAAPPVRIGLEEAIRKAIYEVLSENSAASRGAKLLEQVRPFLSEEHAASATVEFADAVVTRLEQENKIMVVDDIIFTVA